MNTYSTASPSGSATLSKSSGRNFSNASAGGTAMKSGMTSSNGPRPSGGVGILLEQATHRINLRVDGRAADAKTEIRAMVESARRSIGQRFRWIGRR